MSISTLEESLELLPMEADDIEEATIIHAVPTLESVSPKEDRNTDYELIRAILTDTLTKTSNALTGALLSANETKHPRAFEVVGGLSKTIAGVGGDLISLHKTMSDIKTKESEGSRSVDEEGEPSVFDGDSSSLISILEEAETEKST